MAECLTPAQIEALLAGTLPPNEQQRAEEHFAACETCRQLVEARRAEEKLFGQIKEARQDETLLPPASPGGALQAGPPIGESIEGYDILREIHRGGQGVVYKAVQKATKRTVALKVLLQGPYASPKQRQRFEREIDLVASLQHPNIVTIYDSGVAGGRHYFAMEYIHGQPLDVYLSDKHLGIDDTLQLFNKICAAVNYAHQRGVIHRDLKPGNIRIDADGQPHVLDFGLAKAAGPDLHDGAPMTVTGEFMGTLAYASPEQTKGDPNLIDIRTDVYSLGVILYEMLTGKYPYEVVGQMAEVLRNIAETEPRRPSTVRRQINDEVETIVLKALAKGKDRRYASAEALGRDVERYLTGDAIEAKRDSAWYILRKSLRRYRLPVAAVTIFILTVTVSAIALGVMYRNQNSAREEAVRQRDRADKGAAESMRQAEIAQAVNDFLNNDLLAAVAPSTERGRGVDVKMREVLEEASRRIDDAGRDGSRFADKPLIEASIRETIGSTFTKLGLGARAEPHLIRAMELRHSHQGPEHHETLKSMLGLANAYSAEGKYADAQRLCEQTLEIRRRVLGSEHPDTLSSMNSLAMAYDVHEKYADAERLHEQTREIRRRVLGPEHPNTLRSMLGLANAYIAQGKHAEAQSLYEQTLEIRRRVLGSEHPDTLSSMDNLAVAYAAQGKYADAQRLREQTLEIRRRVLGPEHPDTLWSASYLANLYTAQGKYADSQRLYEQTLEIMRRVLGEEHSETLSAMMSLGDAYYAQGQYPNAQRLYGQSLEIQRRVLIPDHGETLRSMEGLAGAYFKQGKYADAEPLLHEAFTAQRRVSGLSNSQTIRLRGKLVQLYLNQKRFDDARPLVVEQIQFQRAAADRLGASAQDLNGCAWTLLTVEPAEMRDPIGALGYARQAVEADGGKDGEIMDTLALAYFLTGDHALAIASEEKAIALLPPGDSPTRKELEANLTRFRQAASSQPITRPAASKTTTRPTGVSAPQSSAPATTQSS